MRKLLLTFALILLPLLAYGIHYTDQMWATDGILAFKSRVTSPAAATGWHKLYAKTDGQLYHLSPTNVESIIPTVASLTIAGMIDVDVDPLADDNLLIWDATASKWIAEAPPIATSLVDGYLDNGDWSTFNGKENVITFSAPLARLVDTVSIPVATSIVDGYLDNADWSTFNSKLGGAGTDTYVPYYSAASTLSNESVFNYIVGTHTLNVPIIAATTIGATTGNFPTVNASTKVNTAKVEVTGSGSGTASIVTPAAAGTPTITLPTVNTTMPTSLPSISGQALKATTAGVQSYSANAMPAADGTVNQFVKTDGAGQLGWFSPSVQNGSFSSNPITSSDATNYRISNVADKLTLTAGTYLVFIKYYFEASSPPTWGQLFGAVSKRTSTDGTAGAEGTFVGGGYVGDQWSYQAVQMAVLASNGSTMNVATVYLSVTTTGDYYVRTYVAWSGGSGVKVFPWMMAVKIQ